MELAALRLVVVLMILRGPRYVLGRSREEYQERKCLRILENLEQYNCDSKYPKKESLCNLFRRQLERRECDTCTLGGNRCLGSTVECTAAEGSCPDAATKCCSQASTDTDLVCNFTEYLTCKSECDSCFEVEAADYSDCTEGNVCCREAIDIRLVGGELLEGNYSGRVEVLYRGLWMTVCDDFWDDTNAMVACKQLGLTNINSARAVPEAFFGEGSGFIILDNVMCEGEEVNLLECPSNALGEQNCGHSGDVGVVCIFTP